VMRAEWSRGMRGDASAEITGARAVKQPACRQHGRSLGMVSRVAMHVMVRQ
jgi:hypothetical protein